MGFKIRGGGGGAPVGAANFRKDIGVGTAIGTVLTSTESIGVGTAIEQAPATLLVEQGVGTQIETFASGTSIQALGVGTEIGTVLTMEAKPDISAGTQIETIWSYTGTKWISTATNIGADNWTNVTNAQDANDGTSATRAGQLLATTSAELRGQFSVNPSGEKDPLTIDTVELRFHVSQSGTLLANGGLGLDWRIGSSGGWTNLASYTGNQNFIATPDVYDITGSIASWANIRDIEIRVTVNLGIATAGVSCACDAVRLHIEASLTE